jgi:hypothetical protein
VVVALTHCDFDEEDHETLEEYLKFLAEEETLFKE